jgi:hypothetical protein
MSKKANLDIKSIKKLENFKITTELDSSLFKKIAVAYEISYDDLVLLSETLNEDEHRKLDDKIIFNNIRQSLNTFLQHR